MEPRYLILIRHYPALPDFGPHSGMSLGERLDRFSTLARIARINCRAGRAELAVGVKIQRTES